VQRRLRFGNGHGGNRKHDWARKRRRRGEKVPVRHRTRERVDERTPVHVTMRLCAGLGSLRSRRNFPVVREALRASSSAVVVGNRLVQRSRVQEDATRDGSRSARASTRSSGRTSRRRGPHRERAFRLTEFSVQTNHLHLIVEADDALALARGMQGLATRLAKRLNRAWDRSGTVFAERYHATLLRSARQIRNALRYVLNNVLRHQGRGRDAVPGPDPGSSGPWFDGWSLAWRRAAKDRGDPGHSRRTSPTATAQSYVLRSLWRRHGLLDPTQRPSGSF